MQRHPLRSRPRTSYARSRCDAVVDSSDGSQRDLLVTVLQGRSSDLTLGDVGCRLPTRLWHCSVRAATD